MEDDQGSGWLTFSAVILFFAGFMKLFDSIWAFRAKGNLESVTRTRRSALPSVTTAGTG